MSAYRITPPDVDTILNPDRGFWTDPLVGLAGPLHGLQVMWDVDDVIMPWAQPVHDAAKELGFHDGSTEWSSWQMWEGPGYTKAEWHEAIVHATANGLYQTPPNDGALECAWRLYWLGATNHVVTARGFMANSVNVRKWTDEYLDKINFPWHTRTFAKDKAQSMREMVRRQGVGFDVAIDDSIRNYRALDEVGVEVYLLTQPHNRAERVGRRVDSVREFADIITGRIQS